MNWDLEKAFRQRKLCGRGCLSLWRGKENGISVLYDDIAADNPSYKLFLKNGFEIDFQDNTVVMVKKTL